MLKKIVVGPYQANCYILGCKDTMEGLVIDPGDEVFRIVQAITESKLTIKSILITHGHIDHVGGAAELKRITGAPVGIHRLDSAALGFPADKHVDEGDTIQLGTYSLKVLHTPGHSPGGVCYLAPGAVFTGDTLFAGSIGRTDFPGGDYQQLIQGVKAKLFTLDDALRVYPGHGPLSTIATERATNPFFR
jgi:glyoxylase-like metal-dependent hydrolase (beta-lactamase superfamily II)